jgi:uncharacterized RmlC-like cupin family protein
MSDPRVIRKNELTAGQPTAGMTRHEAFSTGEVWIGTATTEPGAVSGWHHHGDQDSYVYCVRGTFRVESGPGGGRAAVARAGDFMHIPPQTIHRESNPTNTEQKLVIARVGSGPVVVNVEGPEQ